MKVFRRRIQDSAAGPTSFLADGAKFVGSLSGKGTFIFCGTVEADCDIAGTVTVAAGGRWAGTLKATNVIIAGTVEGDVVAAERVEIAGTAQVTGSLTGHSIAVAEGAVIAGGLKVTSGRQPTQFTEKRQVAAD
jgi:cytoskeletal protein CcmA (bactofilin family)